VQGEIAQQGFGRMWGNSYYQQRVYGSRGWVGRNLLVSRGRARSKKNAGAQHGSDESQLQGRKFRARRSVLKGPEKPKGAIWQSLPGKRVREMPR